MRIYFFAPERAESCTWRTLPTIPAQGETVYIDRITYTVIKRVWDFGSSNSDEAEVTVYLEQA